ncbi:MULTISPECIES: dynamin family protein [unclassified Sporosarcina]|uniref:dynamin family protein n=2 Tax=Sporosarcina TaxID=1569 RepID=UPI00203A7C87|nr:MULTISPECIES: dynamin family protein [unclassified Sporosarcina]GKV67248.1 GTPase [Sporosarcina sp. NCCP-2331]GLB57604.1 GTPase [Sporosarcina sp. NCCP-2378]
MSTNHEFLQRSATYGQIFSTNEDDERKTKTTLLANKIISKEYTIAFAGHFSAGKSSTINALTGDDLLPSSPIPTSANIVKVHKADEDFAIIHRVDGSAVKFSGHGFSEAVKAFSKDGAAVSLVEIGHTESNLPEGITVMDTPGVDSTDDAHRLSTESSLHLADLVFYTMDYNHVQSEMNFRFTKELMRYNSNVYLIINQIDKHRDSELSFGAFKQSVEDSFKLWGVEPKGIFYTSLKELDHPHNDFAKVKAIVDGSIEHREENFEENIDQSLRKLKDEHVSFLKQQVNDVKENYADTVNENEWSQYEELNQDLKEAKKRMELLSGDEFYINFEKERNELLSNAGLAPFETRELLKDYLEAKSPKFKVGLLFGAKKTQEERDRRRQKLDDNISGLAHTQIEIYMKSLMKESLKQAGIFTDERSLAIDAMDLSLPFNEVDEQLHVAEIITGETILNYTEQMKRAIHLVYKRKTDKWKEEMSVIAKSAGGEQSGPLAAVIETLQEKVDAIKEVNKWQERLEWVDKEIDNPSAPTRIGRDQLLAEWQKPKEIETVDYVADQQKEKANTEEQAEDQEEEERQFVDAEKAIAYAQHIADSVHTIPGFAETAAYLQTKAARLKGQEFTVALFGAFSAGKSSFSNALIGEKVLPVSPNPTTAAINRIRPVSEEHLNNTADIHLKDEATMTKDVALSFEALGIRIATLEEAFAKTDEALKQPLEDENLHIHKSFIQAFKKGYPVYTSALGTTLTVDREEFTKFVAQEDRSCFVESIDFFYDSPLTRHGITLVDTPGADSINARHTDVAFEYIRNADAILFVTYYNHAFARADREFLIQLGRVKDAFELDKMFFIVNAIDLASNEEEGEEVKSFVAGELQKFGIRNPRVHGISSLEALEGKLSNEPNPLMQHFEEKFYAFLEHDLRAQVVQALEEETTKTVSRLASLIDRTIQNRSRKAERLEELAAAEQAIKQRFEKNASEVLVKATHDELSELVYYILQRVFLRFSDFFKEGYSPSTFAKNSTDKALKIALAETVNMVGFDLSQELKVTNLRILQYMKKQLLERQRMEVRVLSDMDQSIVPSPYEPNDQDMLSFETPYEDPGVYSAVNKSFKNQKTFFERGDREILRGRLEDILKKDASTYLGEQKERIEKWADLWIDDEAEALRVHLLQESLVQIESERTLLDGSEQLEQWQSIYEKIRQEELIQ